MKFSIRMATALAISFLLGSATLFSGNLGADDNATKVRSSKHQQRGEMTCSSCHKTTSPKPPSSKDCLSCHESFEAVATATTDSKPNPHDSPHYGKALDCELCHHEHSASESFCSQCHDWSLKVP